MMDARGMLQILLGEFNDKLIRVKDLVKREAQFPDAPNKIKVALVGSLGFGHFWRRCRHF